MSVSSKGRQANGQSGGATISANGRFVAFTSGASNLVPGGANNVDVFVRDRVAHTTQRVAVTRGGARARNNDSFGGAISADGRFVVFESWASNARPRRPHQRGAGDVFVRDLATGAIERVNVSSSGAQAEPASDDAVDAHAAISANGRYVVFTTISSNLTAGDTNGDSDVFLRDRIAHTTTRVTAGSATQAFYHGRSVAISASGRFVVFQAWSGNPAAGYDRPRLGPCSCKDQGDRQDRARQREQRGRAGQRRQRIGGDQRGRPVRRVRLAVIEPCPGGRQPQVRPVPARPDRAHDESASRRGCRSRPRSAGTAA